MRRLFTFLLLGVLLASCGSARKRARQARASAVHVAAGTPETHAGPEAPRGGPHAPEVLAKAEAVVETALSFAGVKYRYGGTTRKGMDCSGLLYVSFQQHEIPVPRVSSQMAAAARPIELATLRKGDLLFFSTRKKGKNINHVGLVVEVRNGGDIRFIHSTTSRGVIVSSLNEGYWNYAFVSAARIL
ncbi:C40 family peptidase [Robiginitalea sp. M366]|uniref:C40 family peptidase n=1 Tax=Robiginitalea aestuariiviva TaxID=3036903 RepID=UPI00240E5EFC|nr:C40 family peptidase [Robiginitalea aestuariiviva]MDG1571879.1 C40 family peptidase [Robiginitalea aestuariiviva]